MWRTGIRIRRWDEMESVTNKALNTLNTEGFDKACDSTSYVKLKIKIIKRV